MLPIEISKVTNNICLSYILDFDKTKYSHSTIIVIGYRPMKMRGGKGRFIQIQENSTNHDSCT